MKMIKHIVWWTLQDTAENASAMENGLKIKQMGENLMGQIDELKSIELSVKIQETSTVPVGVVLQTTHNSMEDLKTYNEHPEHQKLVTFIKKVVASRNALDYEI